MDKPDILIKFDGGDAVNHAVNMRLLGASLQGFDRIISDGIILIAARRMPKRGERCPLLIKAQEPKVGSQEIWGYIQEGSWMLPLGWQVLTDSAGNIVWHWVSFVLKYFGGGKEASAKHLDAILELQKLHAQERLESQRLAAQERALSEDRWHETERGWRDQMFALAHRLAGPAAQAVAPVGPSVQVLNFIAGPSPATEVDEPTAENIRKKGVFDMGEKQTLQLRVDGFVHHSRKLNVENPWEPGKYLSADVRDPIFDTVPNPYTEAANRHSVIRVEARPAYRNGELERLYIMDFGGEIGQAA